MGEFIDAATSAVALVFAVPLAVSLILLMVSGAGIFDFDTDSLDGSFGDALDGAGMAGVPPLIVIAVVSLIAWFVAVLAAMFVLEPLNGLALLGVSAVVGVVALVVALFLGGMVARPLGRALETTRAPHDIELVGHRAVVRSGTVDETFGYADASWDDGTVSRVDIRAPKAKNLTSGEAVRLTNWNPESRVYQAVRENEIFDKTGES